MDHVLMGRVLVGIKIADDKKAIKFITEAGDIIAKADGDCCSSTWIENIELPASGFPAKVISVDDIEMPEQKYDKDQYDCLAFYGFKITTDKGEIVIDYRNESNGYYGGSLSFPGDYFYGGVYGQNISTENWIDIA